MNGHEQIGNIDGGQRKLRFLNGILAGTASLVLVVWFIHDDRPGWWLALLFPLHLGAVLGFLQARTSTCILLASRGTCHLGGRADRVDDPELREALATRGRWIARRAFWLAALVTALSVFLLRTL